MAGACAGLRVVEIARGMAGSLAGMILADHGAEVVRLESPRGDPNLSLVGERVWSRGKTRVALDLDDVERRREAQAVLREADVVLLGVRPTTAERWGLTYETLSRANPGLIFASITGFGWDGPARDQPVSEGLMQAMSGSMTAGGNGALRDGPTFFAPHASAYGAALLAVQGVLAALRERDGSGLGQHVDVGLYQANLVYRATGLFDPQFHPEDFPSAPAVADPRGVRPLFNLNQCSDGRWLSMGAWTPALAYRALEVMGLSDLLADERFVGIPNFFPDEAARREVLEILWSRFREKPMQEWLDAMDAQAIPCEPVQTIADFRESQQLWENHHAVRLTDPVLGPMVQPGVLGELSATPGTVRPAAETALPAAAAGDVAARWAITGAVRGRGTMRTGGRGPLAGLRVLDLTMFLSGPMAGHLLSDLGADVVKAEPPEGDDFRMSAPYVFRFLHRDKQSVVVNLKTATGQAAIEQLIAQSDVVLYNYRLGVEERLHLGYDRIRGINPGAIVCRITAFGPRGERAHRGGYDASITALAGLHRFQAGDGNPPVSFTVADISTGLAAATAILLAVRAKDTTGVGQSIEVTMIGAMAYVCADSFPHYPGAAPVETLDSGQRGFRPLYRLYPTRDGWLMVSAAASQAAALRGALGLPIGADLESVDLDGFFGAQSTADWVGALQAAGVACADPQIDPKTFLHSTPEFTRNATSISVAHPRYGTLGQAGPAVRFSRTLARIEHQEAELGEHTQAVLGSLTAQS
ncbi:MAG: CaiB/BaiF CoA transferase family protein [Dehalococcoidia bacterium]